MAETLRWSWMVTILMVLSRQVAADPIDFEPSQIERSRSTMAAHRLYDDLMRNYNKISRPVKHPNQTLHVGIELRLSQIVDLNEKNQVLTTIVYLAQHWFDKSLKWQPAAYDNITSFYVPSNQIWTPDVVLYNNADGSCDITICNKATVYYNGLVTWEPPAIFQSMCMIDVEWFPFDTQVCDLKFGSWTYPVQLLNLYHLNGHRARIDQEWDPVTQSMQNVSVVLDAIDLTDFFPSVEWDILDTPAKRRQHSYNSVLQRDKTFIDISYTLVLRRKPLHYIVNVLIPCAALSFCAMLAFYLPSASSERIGLTISILVSVAVFFLLLAEIVPASSLVLPLIGKYLLFTMLTVTSSVMLTVISLNLYFRKPSTHHMAPWIKHLFIEQLPLYLNMNRKMHNTDKVGSELTHYRNNNNKIINNNNKNNNNDNNNSKKSPSPIIAYHHSYGGKHVINYHEDDMMPGVHRSALRKQATSLLNTATPQMRWAMIRKQKEQLVKELRRAKTAELYYQPVVLKAFDNVCFIAQMMKDQYRDTAVDEDWKFVSMVFDRLCLWLFFFIIAFGNAYIFLRAPTLWDTREPLLERMPREDHGHPFGIDIVV